MKTLTPILMQKKSSFSLALKSALGPNPSVSRLSSGDLSGVGLAAVTPKIESNLDFSRMLGQQDGDVCLPSEELVSQQIGHNSTQTVQSDTPCFCTLTPRRRVLKASEKADRKAARELSGATLF